MYSTTGADIFNYLDGFMKEHEIGWSKCVVITNGAHAISGKYSGLAAKIKVVFLLVEWVHCSIHREALSVKGMKENIKDMFGDSVKIINLIKS